MISMIYLYGRNQIQAGHPIAPHQEAGMENRIQVLKGPFNILQLAQDKRSHFPSPGQFTFSSTSRREQLKNRKSDYQFADFVSSDTTVTVSIATVPNYPPIKTEVPSHGFSVTIPNNCTETDNHVGVYDRQLTHNGVQYSPNTQSRTPPDSTFTESFKDGSQEVCVSIPLLLNPANALPTTTPLLLLRFPHLSSLRSLPSDNRIFT